MKQMQLEFDIAKMLGDKLKAAAAAKNTLTYPTLKEWGLKFTPHYLFRGMCPLHETLSDVGDELKKDRQSEGAGGKRILVIAPRGNAKSTWSTLLIPLRAICEGTEKYIMLIADTAIQAEAYLKSIATELESNEALREAYPLACEQGETWKVSRIETKSGVCIEALGKGANPRGRKFRQYRPSLIIVDDPQSGEDMLSPTGRQKDIEWFDKDLSSAGDTETNIFVVGTMLHRECIVGSIAGRPSYRVIKFAAIREWPTHLDTHWKEWSRLFHYDAPACKDYYIEHKEEMHEGAVVLWPEKEDLHTLMTMREEIGYQAFASEKQNDPRDPSKCEFPEQYFEDCYYKEPPKYNKIVTVGYLDPAKGTDTKRHDYPAIIILHYLPEFNKVLVECDMRKRPINERIDDIIAWHSVVKFSAFGVESVGMQYLVGEELIAKAKNLNVLPIDNTGQNKNIRISRLGFWLHKKFFLFKSGDADTKILLQQLKDHPHADHDDGPDALEGALRVLSSITDFNNVDSVDVEFMDDGLGDNLLSGSGEGLSCMFAPSYLY
jgi:hypothetical protein